MIPGSSGRTVLVAGATGYIGRHVVQALHREGHAVRALVRDEAKLGEARAACREVFVGEATNPDSLKGLCSGIDVVVSSLGKRDFSRKPSVWDVSYQANINVLERAVEGGVKHFVLVAVMNGDALRKRGVEIARALEGAVDHVKSSGLPWTIIRPTGAFNDMNEIFEMASRGSAWLIGSGCARMNPIHAADLADKIVHCLGDESAKNRETSVGGPDVVSFREIVEMAFAALGKEPRIRSLPRWLVAASIPFVKLFNPMIATVMAGLYHAETLNMCAPPHGTRHLREFFAKLAAR